MRQLRGILKWTAACALALAFSPAALADDAFSGGWQVHCKPNSATVTLGADTFDDGFLFEGDQFSAQAYAAMGFTPSSYTIDSTGKFTATLTSTDRGTVVWKGRVGSSGIYGWITWTKPDGTVFKYTYTGSAVAAGASES